MRLTIMAVDFVLFGIACAAPEPTPTPIPGPTPPPRPTATPTVMSTPSPTPTATASPTPTIQPTPTPPCHAFDDVKSAWDGGNPTCAGYPYPTPTPTPRPTATPTPRPTPTPAPTPTPTQVPVSHLGKRSFDFMQALTGSTFLTDDAFHAGYIGYNERDETFNALYYVPVSDEPTSILTFMGSTLSQGHYARTLDRVLILMGFYPDVVREFTTDFVAQAEEREWYGVSNLFFGWRIFAFRDEQYKGVVMTLETPAPTPTPTTPIPATPTLTPSAVR